PWAFYVKPFLLRRRKRLIQQDLLEKARRGELAPELAERIERLAGGGGSSGGGGADPRENGPANGADSSSSPKVRVIAAQPSARNGHAGAAHKSGDHP
ncbi:MAG: hypothetical protein ACT4PL_06865, partial [Phycisphaerales bacterium]